MLHARPGYTVPGCAVPGCAAPGCAAPCTTHLSRMLLWRTAVGIVGSVCRMRMTHPPSRLYASCCLMLHLLCRDECTCKHLNTATASSKPGKQVRAASTPYACRMHFAGTQQHRQGLLPWAMASPCYVSTVCMLPCCDECQDTSVWSSGNHATGAFCAGTCRDVDGTDAVHGSAPRIAVLGGMQGEGMAALVSRLRKATTGIHWFNYFF